jgi:hypothetical protein
MVHDFVMAFGFVAMVLSPCVTAAFCASERRLVRIKTPNRCPAIDRRDNR